LSGRRIARLDQALSCVTVFMRRGDGGMRMGAGIAAQDRHMQRLCLRGRHSAQLVVQQMTVALVTLKCASRIA
jgi:hypothetical protein